jgi:hypothetical protein
VTFQPTTAAKATPARIPPTTPRAIRSLRPQFTKEPQLVTVRIYTFSVRRGSWLTC